LLDDHFNILTNGAFKNNGDFLQDEMITDYESMSSKNNYFMFLTSYLFDLIHKFLKNHRLL